MLDNSKLSSSMQDYLEAILELEENENQVRVTDIANRLKIAKASVNQTIGKLKETGLIRQQAYGPVELTGQGRELAGKIVQRHRKLRKFLVEVLGVDQQTAEQDACLMEHAVSPQTMDRLTDFLSNNGYLNDGHSSKSCIDANEKRCETADTRKGENYMKDNTNIVTLALSELKKGQRGKVIKVSTKGAIRRRIMEMGIITGTEVLVKGFAPLGDPMELGIKGYNLSLRKAEVSEIMVELL